MYRSIICAAVVTAALVGPINAQNSVITIGPKPMRTYPSPDFSPVEEGYKSFGEGLGKMFRSFRERRTQSDANAALARVLKVGLRSGYDAALAAASETPDVFEHPRFMAIMQMIWQRGR